MSAAPALQSINQIAPVSETAAIIHMIERAARDPSMDIDKLERLIQMRERQEAREAESKFNAAMAAAQAEMRPVSADANNPQTKSKYASYFALDKAIRPIYTKHGFSLSFDEGDCPKPEHIRVLCYVANAGHIRVYRKDMPADGKGAKGGDVMTKTHASGAAATYGARYLLKGIFNIAIGESDDDGNAAGGGPVISAEQVERLQSLIVQTGSDIAKFCAWLKVERIEHLPVRDFGRALAALERKVAQEGGAS
jgi:hypothetical protein